MKYFVMCLHKCKLNFTRIVPGKVGECYLTFKSATASGALSRPQTPSLVMYLQTKPNEQIKPLIFSHKENENCICQNGQGHIEIDIL